ncbi:heterokaryon incompatibility protein-domain-containing protein [Triangularia verruculosa]|uniref:Heterokaryon incompatibility protein-domain-containing protein n=1 Tax=Triangularia verruculosa TaxID=2587418 RepID=A0AAN6XH93_9PEZI|nr:heterokaryon incompatibility protein-domain-containing protein [Triangularia verruculosa]
MASPYSPLQREPREIRLLDIEPWTTDRTERIRLRVFPTELDKAGDYICLSYTWGMVAPLFPVVLNGIDFCVRENLYSALLRLRLPDKAVRIWIDAVCINQDIEERGFQVSLMRDVYRGATHVIAWIGEENGPGDKEAVDFVEKMFQVLLPLNSSPPEEQQFHLDTVLKWVRSITMHGIEGTPWLSLLGLISRPRFSRVWIVQEVVMAKHVLVQCGPHQVPWAHLFSCASFFSAKFHLIMSLVKSDIVRSGQFGFFSKQGPFVRLCAASKHIGKVGSLFLANQGIFTSLYDVLCYFRTFKATDERDRVYALLGLAESIQNIPRPLPTVLYHDDVGLVDILLNVHANDLKGGARLDFLPLAYGVEQRSRNPSWIPRLVFDNDDRQYIFTMPRQFRPLWNERGVTPYRADGLSTNIHASVDVKNRRLNVVGLVAGVVNQVSQIHSRGDWLKIPETFLIERPEYQHAARAKWAAQIGVTASEAKYRLLHNPRTSESVKAKLRLLHLPDSDLHQRFLGTLLMSGCDAGIQALSPESSLGDRDAQTKREWTPFQTRIAHTCHARRFFLCAEAGVGYEILQSTNFGLCASDTREGDKVVMLLGSITLHIIREIDTDDSGGPLYGWVGQAYVHNWMQGQLVDKVVDSAGTVIGQRIALV